MDHSSSEDPTGLIMLFVFGIIQISVLMYAVTRAA